LLSKGTGGRVETRNKKPSAETEGYNRMGIAVPANTIDANSHIVAGDRISIKQETIMAAETIPHLRILRSLHENPRYTDACLAYQAILNRLLYLAAFYPMELNIQGNIIVLQPGQIGYSWRMLREKCGPKVTMGLLRGAIRFWRRVGFLTHFLTHDRLIITLSPSILYAKTENEPNTLSNTELTQSSHSKEERREVINRETSPTSPKKIERGGWVKTTEIEHQKLIEKWGTETKVLKIYTQMVRWGDGKVVRGKPFEIAMGWGFEVSKEDVILEHKEHAEKVVREYISEYWKAELSKESIYFYPMKGQSAELSVKYGESGFFDKVDQILKQKGFVKRPERP
jgi:hypothetical protein